MINSSIDYSNTWNFLRVLLFTLITSHRRYYKVLHKVIVTLPYHILMPTCLVIFLRLHSTAAASMFVQVQPKNHFSQVENCHFQLQTISLKFNVTPTGSS